MSRREQPDRVCKKKERDKIPTVGGAEVFDSGVGEISVSDSSSSTGSFDKTRGVSPKSLPTDSSLSSGTGNLEDSISLSSIVSSETVIERIDGLGEVDTNLDGLEGMREAGGSARRGRHSSTP